MGLGFSAEMDAIKQGVIAGVEVLVGAGIVYGGARVSGAFIGGNIGSMVAGTSIGFGIMMGGAALAYDGVKRVWPEIKADVPFGDLALAALGPYLVFEGALLFGQGEGFNTTATLIGLVAQENFWLAAIGGTAMTVGSLLTLNSINQFYTFLPYGWHYKTGVQIAMLGGSSVLALAGGYKLANDPGFNKFDLGITALGVAGMSYFGYATYHEWMRYKGYVICPQDKKKYYLSGDTRSIDTYDKAVIKLQCDAVGAGLSDRDYRQEYFDRIKKLYEDNANKGIFKTQQAGETTCAAGFRKIQVGPYAECQPEEYFDDYKPSYKQPDSTTANTQNTTGSGLNTGNAKKAGKGK